MDNRPEEWGGALPDKELPPHEAEQVAQDEDFSQADAPTEEIEIPLSVQVQTAIESAVANVLSASRREIVEMIAEGVEEGTRRAMHREPVPEIAYNERFHWFKLFLNLSAVIGVALITLTATIFVLVSANFMAWLFPVVSLILLATWYVSAREHFRWKNLWLRRSGGILYADKTPSRFFLIFDEGKTLQLNKVISADKKNGLLETFFPFDRVKIDTASDQDQYWHHLHFVVNGEQFVKAVNQGR